MTDSPALRLRRAIGAFLCLAALVTLAVMVSQHWSPLATLDRNLGREPQSLTYSHHWLRELAFGIEAAFTTLPMTALTVVVAIALAVKGQRRAALYAVGVMLVSWASTFELKRLVGRHRPVWENPVKVWKDFSFPSGHATISAAAAFVACVLAMMFIRRRGLRRLAVTASLLVALLVGLDRIFLGVHNPSDVLAGWLVATVVGLVGLLLFDPTPRSIAQALEPLPEAVPVEARTVAVILNPVKVDDPAAFRHMVQTMATDSGFAEVKWWETTVDDTGYGMAHEAAVSGAHLVIAIGGDGTIRAVCEELAGTGIPVGIVPAGTGNLLARNLDIPLYLRAAVDVAMHGQDRAIDMVEVSGDDMEDAIFLVMAGMGFDAAIMEGVNEQIKAKVGWLAYVWSALKSLLFPAISVEVSVDGGEFTKHKARTIVIGNVGYLQAGMPLIPDAAIDDGQLDVVLLYPRRFLSWLPLAARVLTKNPRTDETITRMTGREVVVRTGAEAPRQLDGDLIAPGREIRATCVHGRLLVRVPR